MKTIFSILFVFAYTLSFTQEVISLDGLKWQLEENAKTEVYKTEECLNTQGGAAVVNNFRFQNGIIEFSMCIQEGRGFAGVRFHDDGNNNAEEFYIRKHQSGNPDAMQYTPVYNGNAGWQLYYGDGYSTAKQHKFDEWFKIRLVIAGSKAEVYIEDMEKPVLVIHELKMGKKEGNVEFYGPARFANIKITKADSPELKGTFKEIVKAGNEVIQSFSVSELIDSQPILTATGIKNDFIKNLKFTNYGTEADGLINLSQTGTLAEGKNAVLLKIKIKAETEIVKPLTFGFSDAAKVFVNGKAIWLGVDNYGSRDYRFLGTIGYFDTVYLDLKKGDNEIIIAVAESFGGWGIKAKFDNLDGIEIVE
ncbi:MAG: hypothetical protein HQ541_09385 [Mariniphaga sp.]|nr:hypothetical protein [Mariniphaga sp.]